MFMVFILSLVIIVYYISMEFDKPVKPLEPLTGGCPNCAETVQSGWLVCPHCRTILRSPCKSCNKVHDLWVQYCPWCGQPNQEVAA
jgi:hypothetical protein